MRIRSFIAWGGASPSPVPGSASPAPGWRTWQHGALHLRFAPRQESERDADPTLPLLVLGDDAELDPARPAANMAGGVPLRFDEATGSLVLHTSIVGLPPVYIYRGPGITALASDIHLLSQVPGARLDFDPLGISELGHFGHPVEQRTLFRGVELAPGGHRLAFGADGTVALSRSWSLPARDPVSRPEFIEAQMAEFIAAVRRTNTAGSFLSLTAGLDTRTVFSALAAEGRLIPAATMTSSRLSLDARIAARLCRAYGVRHELVTFDSRFVRELPRWLETASRLSAGLSTLGQAPEVFLYDQAGGGFAARLSGNLGNQVGRGGTEGVSVREADLAILAPGLRAQVGGTHWLLDKLARDERSTIEFILQSEIAFSSVGNFSVGNHFAAQQSPYASRGLIETLARKPAGSAPSGSMLQMRLRDLKHRFLGESEQVSFQRALVHRLGGAAADIPINWGWKPRGGVSPAGLALGTATLFGMAARAKGLDDGLLRVPLQLTGLPALHDFRDSRRWLRVDLRDYLLDTLRSQRTAALFERSALDPILDEHFSGRRDHYETVTFALDVALASRIFIG